MSIALVSVLVLLARDTRRRLRAESATWPKRWPSARRWRTRSSPACARDLHGRITYVNPAFCAMVGFSAEDADRSRHRRGALLAARAGARVPAAPGAARWPAAVAAARRLRDGLHDASTAARFPVMIYEAPLVNAHRPQTGWMSAILDLSAQRNVEELSRASSRSACRPPPGWPRWARWPRC